MVAMGILVVFMGSGGYGAGEWLPGWVGGMGERGEVFWISSLSFPGKTADILSDPVAIAEFVKLTGFSSPDISQTLRSPEGIFANRILSVNQIINDRCLLTISNRLVNSQPVQNFFLD